VKKKQWIILAAAIFIVACIGFLPPPIDGCYRSSPVAILDGSIGYLQLHEGVVDVLNLGGAGPDSRMHLGTYRLLGDSEIEIVFAASFHHAPERVRIGWSGFHFSPDFARGMPDGSRCSREIFPWRLIKLGKIK
jgi:hypothetical protein